MKNDQQGGSPFRELMTENQVKSSIRSSLKVPDATYRVYIQGRRPCKGPGHEVKAGRYRKIISELKELRK